MAATRAVARPITSWTISTLWAGTGIVDAQTTIVIKPSPPSAVAPHPATPGRLDSPSGGEVD